MLDDLDRFFTLLNQYNSKIFRSESHPTCIDFKNLCTNNPDFSVFYNRQTDKVNEKLNKLATLVYNLHEKPSTIASLKKWGESVLLPPDVP
jgi:hypothetical protein